MTVFTAAEARTAEERTEEARTLVTLIDAKLSTRRRVVFSVRTMEFLNDMRQRLRRFPDKSWVTPKQLGALESMKDRLF